MDRQLQSKSIKRFSLQNPKAVNIVAHYRLRPAVGALVIEFATVLIFHLNQAEAAVFRAPEREN